MLGCHLGLERVGWGREGLDAFQKSVVVVWGGGLGEARRASAKGRGRVGEGDYDPKGVSYETLQNSQNAKHSKKKVVI